jgi:hypothetical protein
MRKRHKRLEGHELSPSVLVIVGVGRLVEWMDCRGLVVLLMNNCEELRIYECCKTDVSLVW